MDQFLFSYGDSLVMRLEKQFRKRKRKNLPKNIHGFRLLVKRIKTLLRLLNQTSRERVNEKHLKPLKRINNGYGRVRDLQIHRKLLKGLRIEPESEMKKILRWIGKAEKKAIHQVDVLYKKLSDENIESVSFLFKEIENKNIDYNIHNCYRFIESKHSTIKKMAGENAEDAVLHEIRKHLKDIVFTLQMLKAQDSTFAIPNESLNWLNDLQERLGLWNDWYNLQQMLTKIKKKLRNPKFEALVSIEKEKCKQNILECLSKFCELDSIL